VNVRADGRLFTYDRHVVKTHTGYQRSLFWVLLAIQVSTLCQHLFVTGTGTWWARIAQLV
jgi:hypothetical protein